MSAELILGIVLLLPLAAVPLAALVARSRPVEDWLVLGVLVVEAVSCLLLLGRVSGGTTVVLPMAQVAVGGWTFDLHLAMGLLGAALLTLVVLLALATTAFAAAQAQWPAQQRYQSPLLLLAIGVLAAALASGNLLTLYALWQLSVLATALALTTGLHAISLRAAGRYLVAGELSALLLLTASALASSRGAGLDLFEWQASTDGNFRLAMYLLLGSAAALTLPVPPFHNWQGAAARALEPTFAAFWLNLHNKLGFFLLARLTLEVAGGLGTREWGLYLTILGVLAVAVGAVSVLGQRHVGRLVAFLLMAQSGYVLLGLGTGEPIGRLAALFLIFVQPVAATTLLLAAAQPRPVGRGGPRFAIQAGAFLVGALSLAGLPPSPGFVGLLLLSQGLAATGDVWRLALVALILVTTVVSTTMLARLGATLFLGWDEDAQTAPERLGGLGVGVLALLGLATLALGLLPRLLLDPLVAPLVGATTLGSWADIALLLVPGRPTVTVWSPLWLVGLLLAALGLVFLAARFERANPYPVVAAGRQDVLPLARALSPGQTPVLVVEGEPLVGSRRLRYVWQWLSTYLDAYGLGAAALGLLARGAAVVVRVVFRVLLR